MRVELQDGGGADCGHRALHEVVDGLRLRAPVASSIDVAGVQDGAQPLGHHVVGHLVEAVEEAGVVPAGLLDQRLDPGPGRQR